MSRAKFRVEDPPAAADADFVRAQLAAYNGQFAPPDQHRYLAIFERDATGQIIAGLLGDTYWEWLYVGILWVDARYRRTGLGSALLAAAEAEARARGCRYSHLETHPFQAPDFYRRHGYEVYTVLEDLPPGHKKIFLKKRL